jgi:hypothetical protein
MNRRLQIGTIGDANKTNREEGEIWLLLTIGIAKQRGSRKQGRSSSTPGPNPAHGLKAMAAVGSPEATARRRNSDDGIEKTPSLY